MRSLFIVLTACCCVPQAAAVNKCVNDQGDAITYTEAPCTAEAQRVNSSENTVRRQEVDKQRMLNEQVQSQHRARQLQRDHDEQYNHAVRVRTLAEAEERSRAARNGEVGPIVPRTPVVQNPGVSSPNWYSR